MNVYKNILITGGCGFIGSNFINYIFDKCTSNIINVDKINYCSNKNNINKFIRNNKRYLLYTTCLSNRSVLEDILNNHSIDLIIHFAAQSHVTKSFSNINDFIEDNIISSYILLETVKKYNKIVKFINISTDEVYGESNINTDIPKIETDKLEPTNPYSASKACVEMLAKAYIHSYKLPIITVRCNNVYGINQFPEKVIPKFIKQLKENKKITIEGDGSNKRTFIHTDDVCEALITIINKGILFNIYNIGNNDDELTILELAKKLIKYIKKDNDYEKYILFIDDRLYNDTRYYINYDKLKQLGWKPTKKINNELNNIIHHY